MITVVMHKWGARYTARHVNVLAAMVARNLALPHEFLCITDDPAGIAAHIRTLPIGPEIGFATHPRRPNCYRRLRLFARDAGDWLGARILSIDLDTVITGDITPLIDRPEDFVIVHGRRPATPYNGSMWLLSAGARPQVWETLDPDRAPLITKREGRIGSDQAWIAHVLGDGEAVWGTRDGIFGYGVDVLRGHGGRLPDNARIVFFWGDHDPAASDKPWVKEYWR